MGSCIRKEVKNRQIVVSRDETKSELESNLLDYQNNQEYNIFNNNKYVSFTFGNDEEHINKVKSTSISTDNCSVKNNLSTDTDSTVITNRIPFISYFTKSNDEDV